MEKKKPVKAVIFDLGETLLNFGRVKTLDIFIEGTRLSCDFLKSNGWQPKGFRRYCISSLMSFYLNRVISKITGNDFDSLELLKKNGRKKGIKLTDAQWLEYIWCWYKPLQKIGQVEKNIKQTLTRLKEMDLKLAILSNTFVHNSCLERHLEQLGILNFFDARFYSYQFDFRKPDVRIFRDVAKRIDEDPESIVFVGDRINKDITPALKAGMYAVAKSAYTNTGKKIPHKASKINHIAELPALIEKINGKF